MFAKVKLKQFIIFERPTVIGDAARAASDNVVFVAFETEFLEFQNLFFVSHAGRKNCVNEGSNRMLFEDFFCVD